MYTEVGRTRIRDAALRQFAVHGFKATTIRSVAAEADVSPALVQRHYGTKEGLREACDAHAIGTLLEQARRSMAGEAANPGFVPAMFQASRLSTAYLARALVEGSTAAAEWFDQGAALAEEFLTTNWPERFAAGSARTRDAAAAMAAMHGGPIVLHEHLSRWAGVDMLQPETASRLGAAIGDVYGVVGEYLAAGVGGQLNEAVQTAAEEGRTHEGAGDD